MLDQTPVIISILAFGAVAATIFAAGRFFTTQALMQRRLSVPTATSPASSPVIPERTGFLDSLARRIDEKKFGVDSTLHAKIKRELVRAGYFSNRAVQSYVFFRFATILIFPTVIFLASNLARSGLGWLIDLLLLVISVVVAILGPDAYIARRQRHLIAQYRVVFPDFLDMLVVCVDAGLSLDAAFDRVGSEITKRSRALGMNLAIMGAEVRAGRSNMEALQTFADRLNLDEARTFVAMVRQSLELGTDVGDALRVFSDEMRDKRFLRAEEIANKLPVKLVLPLGLCIFPVILMVVMLPVMIRLLSIMR